MALAETVKYTASVSGDHLAQVSRPAQSVCDWVQAIAAGGMVVTDNAGAVITTPDSQITHGSRRIISAESGTLLRVRLRVPVPGDLDTPPAIQIFARTRFGQSKVGGWEELSNKEGTRGGIELNLASNDVRDSVNVYSHPQLLIHTFDLDGCNEVLVGVKTAMAGDQAATACVDVKMI